MLDPVRQTILYDYNAIWFGYPIERLMERAGMGIARVLADKFGPGKKYGFFCGPGNNGGDGFAAARYLSKQAETEVYLIPANTEIKSAASRKNWRLFRGKKSDKVKASDIPDDFDVVVECLFGTGIKGRLRAPYPAVIRRLNRLKGKKAAIDLPAPGFRADHFISLMAAKVPGAEVVDIGYPKWLEKRIGIGEVKVLKKPGEKSHKGENGKVLIIGGSEKYHGAVLLATEAASKIVDLVYVSSTDANNKLAMKMKSKYSDFIALERQEAIMQAGKVDAVLIGPGWGVNSENEEFLNNLLKKYPRQKFILDAAALKMVDKNLLNKNIIITPHAGEFRALFGVTAGWAAAKRLAKRSECTIVFKGKTDYVCDKFQDKENSTGNAGMTKGGTGDVLAGLTTGLAAQNDNFLAASAGVFINGLAGDRLAKRVARYYSASDLVREIPRAFAWCEKY